MKPFFVILGLSIFGAMLCGCRTVVPDVQLVECAEEVPCMGTMTLIRIEPEPSADELLVYTNGVLLAVVGNYSFATLKIQEGSHLFTLDWGDTPLQFEEEIVLDLAVHTNMYLSVRHQFDVPEISRNETGIDYTMVETLVLFEVPEGFGLELISRLYAEDSYVFEEND